MNLIDRVRIFLLFKNFACRLKLPLAVFLFLGSFTLLMMCTSPKKSVKPSATFSVNKEERGWLQEFFHDLLFESPGAYVLYGTKPMSLSCIKKAYTEEEQAQMKVMYDALSEQEKTKYIVREDDEYDFYANFHKWEQIKQRFSITQYLFGTFPARFNPDGSDLLFFVNIEMAIRTLLKYYEDFRRILGFDFDPLQVVFEIENRESKFWNRVIHDDVLLGILLGFGRDNAWFFKWRMELKEEPNKVGDFLKTLPVHSSNTHRVLYPNPEEFMLPIFMTYGLHPTDQQLIEQYKKEREQIKVLYKGRDEVDLALEWLTRCAPQAHE